MIPKRMFFYWNSINMSWMRYMTLYSFRKMNPDWEMVLYISDNKNLKNWNGVEEQDCNNYVGKNYMDNLNDLNIQIRKVEMPPEYANKFKDISPIQESDIFRYYKLYDEGGFYSDMDILYFKSMNSLHRYVTLERINTVLHQSKDYMTIGFLGSCKNNDFFHDLFMSSLSIDNYNDYQSFGVDHIYRMFNANRGNAYILPYIRDRYKRLNIYNIPDYLVYQYDWTKIGENYNNPYGRDKFEQKAIGYHWYGGSPISQKYNNILNEDNYKEHLVTFSALAEFVINKNKI